MNLQQSFDKFDNILKNIIKDKNKENNDILSPNSSAITNKILKTMKSNDSVESKP